MNALSVSSSKLQKLRRKVEEEKHVLERICEDALEILQKWPERTDHKLVDQKKKTGKVDPDPVEERPPTPEEVKLADKILAKARKHLHNSKHLPEKAQVPCSQSAKECTANADISQTVPTSSLASSINRTAETSKEAISNRDQVLGISENQLESVQSLVTNNVPKKSAISGRSATTNKPGVHKSQHQPQSSRVKTNTSSISTKPTSGKKPAIYQTAPYDTKAPVQKVKHKPTRAQLLRANLNRKDGSIRLPAVRGESSKEMSDVCDKNFTSLSITASETNMSPALHVNDAGSHIQDLSDTGEDSKDSSLKYNSSTDAIEQNPSVNSSASSKVDPDESITVPGTERAPATGFDILKRGKTLTLPGKFQKMLHNNKKLRQTLWLKSQKPELYQHSPEQQDFLNGLEKRSLSEDEHNQAILQTLHQLGNVAKHLHGIIVSKIPDDISLEENTKLLYYKQLVFMVHKEYLSIKAELQHYQKLFHFQQKPNLSSISLRQAPGSSVRKTWQRPSLLKYRTKHELVSYYQHLYRLQRTWIVNEFLNSAQDLVLCVADIIQDCDDKTQAAVLYQNLYALICTTNNCLPILVFDVKE